MSRLRARLEILVWRHGWAWLLAAGLGLAAAVLQGLIVQPSWDALAAVQKELTVESRTARPRPLSVAPIGEKEKLEAFRNHLRAAPAEEAAKTLAALAQAERIELARSDYQQQKHPSLPVMQVQVVQPLHASYPQLRKYIESVLLAVPNASLDQIAARRDTVAQSQLDVRLQWTIWSSPPEAGSGTALGNKTP